MEDDLTRRLRAFGTEAVPPGTSASHLAAMADVGAPRERRRFGRVAVGLAALTGFLVGGSGLAMAGALPAPAQDAAADVLAQVGLDAPRPASREYGRCVSDAAKLHGDDDEVATEVEGDNSAFKDAKEACEERKAVKGGNGPKEGKGQKDDGDPCTGPPPWAGRDDEEVEPTDQEVAAHREACGRGVDGAEGRKGPKAAKGPREDDACKGRPPWAGTGVEPTDDERASHETTCPDDEGDGPAANGAAPEEDVEGERPEGSGAPDGAGAPEGIDPPAGSPEGEGDEDLSDGLQE